MSQTVLFNDEHIRFKNGELGLIKRRYGEVVTAYVLDDNGNKIPDGGNIHGEPSFKIAISCNYELVDNDNE